MMIKNLFTFASRVQFVMETETDPQRPYAEQRGERHRLTLIETHRERDSEREA